MAKLLLFIIVIAVYVAVGQCLSGSTIAATADRHIGSTKWAKAASYSTGRNTWKCNIFVADVLKEAGGSVPMRKVWFITRGPIGAGEWANPSSSYLTNDRCWTRTSVASLGVVMGYGGHVGIVTGNRQTTSAAEFQVVKNDWGFRSGQNPTMWKYVC